MPTITTTVTSACASGVTTTQTTTEATPDTGVPTNSAAQLVRAQKKECECAREILYNAPLLLFVYALSLSLLLHFYATLLRVRCAARDQSRCGLAPILMVHRLWHIRRSRVPAAPAHIFARATMYLVKT